MLDVPGELLALDAALSVAGGLVWTPTDAGEHPNSDADQTNTATVALENFMWPSLAERLPHVAERRHSITTERSEIATAVQRSDDASVLAIGRTDYTAPFAEITRDR